MIFAEIIEASLLPRFLHLHGARPEPERARLRADFRDHVRRLSEYLHREVVEKSLTPATAIGLHTLLYPPGYMIPATGRDGALAHIPPGGWRQREIIPPGKGPLPWYTLCSSTAAIPEDLARVMAECNQLRAPQRVDILRFYFLFLKVHPFADSNGTTAALLADALCARQGFAPLLMLRLRFKGEAFFHQLLYPAFAGGLSDQTLAMLLHKINALGEDETKRETGVSIFLSKP